MPYGPGTYGSKVGRPKKSKKKMMAEAKSKKKSARKKAAMRRVSKEVKKPGYKKAHDYVKKSSAILGSGGYQEEASRVNDARNRSKKTY